jgi:hypothetical protein
MTEHLLLASRFNANTAFCGRQGLTTNETWTTYIDANCTNCALVLEKLKCAFSKRFIDGSRINVQVLNEILLPFYCESYRVLEDGKSFKYKNFIAYVDRLIQMKSKINHDPNAPSIPEPVVVQTVPIAEPVVAAPSRRQRRRSHT